MSKREVIGVLRGAYGRSGPQSKGARFEFEAYAGARGWHDITVMEAQDNMPLFGPDGEPHTLLARLSEGTTVIVQSLGALSDKPSDIKRGVQRFFGNGITVHSCDIGSLVEHFATLEPVWQHASQLEAALEAERASRAEEAGSWAALFDDFQRKTIADLVRRFGVPDGGLPPITIPAEVQAKAPLPATNGTAKADPKVLGAFLKQKRLERGWSQAEMASQLDSRPSTSVVSRMESAESTSHTLEALKLLAPETLPDGELDGVIDPLTFATFRAKAEMAREPRPEPNGADFPPSPFAGLVTVETEQGDASP